MTFKSLLISIVAYLAISFCAATSAQAAPVTYQFTGQIDVAEYITTAVPGDPWFALVTFDDSDLTSGALLDQTHVLEWELTVPTDPQFDLSSNMGDVLTSFAGIYDINMSGSSDITLSTLTADNDALGMETVYWGDTGDIITINTYDGRLLDTDGWNGVVGTVVPVPAAIWLFASGLIGLIGVTRRKKV